MKPVPASNNQLMRVAALRQGIRVIVSAAFRVNTLGLNAILLAKRFGEQARGFGVISSELRAFSKSLGQDMDLLSRDSAKLVDLATRQLKLQRQMDLMQQAANHVSHADLAAALMRQEHASHGMTQDIAALGLHMEECVERAHESCLFGSVIARSARIEAAHAGNNAAALTEASFEFARQVDAVIPTLERLRAAIKG